MIQHWKIIFTLIASLILFLSCTTPNANSVKPSINNGGKENGSRQKDGGNKADPGTLPKGVKEITPSVQGSKTLLTVTAAPVSKKDYIRARFPGKKVIFPDEIKIPEKKPEYRIGVDDVLSILVWNHPDLTIPGVTVRRDGKISLPLVGNIQAEGLTIPALEEILRKGLNRFIENPQVSVNPREMNSQRVFLIGQLKKSTVTVGPLLPIFLLKGGNTLLEALSDIEFNSDADMAASYINRKDTIIPVNIKALLMDGDLSQNVYLEPGDRVIVPGPMKEVNVLGEVNQPNKFKVNLDTSLLDALSMAQGPRRETSDLYMAYVARNRQILPVNLKRLLDYGDMSQNIIMEDGDIIYVPNIDEKKYYVLGEVSKPGVVYFRDPVDLIEAIAQGGGFLTTAQRKQVVVVRGDIRTPHIYAIDTLAMLEGRSLERFTLQKGDIIYVPRTPIADWNVFVTQILPTFQAAALVDLMVR
jgi:polysaccharide biosynthesis/export protein